MWTVLKKTAKVMRLQVRDGCVQRDVDIRPHLVLGDSHTKHSGHISPMCMKLAPVHCSVWDLMLRNCQENKTTCKT